MTSRDRHVLAGRPSVAPPLPVRPVSEPAGQRLSWEELFPQAPPLKQQELLELARRQGLLYSHQLPSGAIKTQGSPTATASSQTITRLLSGQVDALPPLPSIQIHPLDGSLDLVQRAGVVRALSSPDISLIAGWPGTGKSRVITEILAQAGSQGLRILFLGASSSAIDTVLERLGENANLFPVRLLEAEENPKTLSSTVQRRTISAQGTALARESQEAARQNRKMAEGRCQARRLEEPLWADLRGLAEQIHLLQGERERIKETLAAIPNKVEREANSPDTPLAARLKDLKGQALAALAERENACRQAEMKKQQAEARLAALVEESNSLRPLAVAKKLGRWWTAVWWKANQGHLDRFNELEKLRHQEEATSLTAGQELNRFVMEARGLTDGSQEAKAQIQQEIEQRQANLARQDRDIQDREKAILNQSHVLIEKLGGLASPDGLTASAVEAAKSQWQVHLEKDEETCRFAHQWSAFLESHPEALAERLPALANLVAGTTQALRHDRFFAEGTSEGAFDLLVLDEAEQITESEFLKLATRARRWVLVGEPAWENPEGCNGTTHHENPRPVARALPVPERLPASLRTGFFHRLWQQLHADPGRLPYTWLRENGRVCCRLRAVSPDQRPFLESEKLEDFPDIELRILNLPRTLPVLAEVTFPESMPLYRAKEFIFQELQELPVEAAGRNLVWCENEHELCLCFHHAETEGDRAALAPGAVECGPTMGNWRTGKLCFDQREGWTKERAAVWVEQNLHLRSRERTTLLQVPYRMEAALAAHLGELLPWGKDLLPARMGTPETTVCPVEFVAIPLLRNEPGETRKKPAGAGQLWPRDGAGLELDLALPRNGDRLPIECRIHLPDRGFVNYLEAQAVVRRLEEIAGANFSGSLVVLALYEAQVKLIRRLLQQSETLQQVKIDIGLPGAFRQQEFDVVLISLTRSHSHRPVCYGEEAAQLALALTRARSRLILFGDPGSLVKRSQWQGALDHLDSAGAAREAHLITRLVRHLQGQLSRTIPLCESNGP